MENEEDQKKTKGPLNINWDVVYPKNENGPPAEVVVVGGHFDDDKKQREADLSEATDHQLREKIKRLERHSSGFLKLPDKGEKLRKSLKLHIDELERRNLIRLRKEAECEKSSQSRSSGLPGACNSHGSEAPSQAHSKSRFGSSFGEHLDDKPDLRSRISVNPVSKKLSLVGRDNHRNTSSKELLMNNGGREIKAMKISPQCRGISGRDERRSSIGAQNTIDSSRFYPSHSDGNSSVRSSKRRKASPVQASKQSHMKEFCPAVDVSSSKKRETVVLLDEEDCQPTETIQEEDETLERMEAKIYYPSRDDPQCVEVHYSDIKCLAPEAFLSSTIMNFYIRYLQRPVSATGKSRSDNHFFSTYFYGKVKEAVSSKGNDKATVFSKLRRWWKGVNIFEKAYILLPINEDYHWSLVIICLPNKKDEAGPIILHLDSLGYHRSPKIFQNVRSFLKEEWEYLKMTGEALNLPIADKIWKQLPRRIDEKNITVPQQKNDYDCGIFVLYFMERFIEDAPERLSKKDLAMFGSKWFKSEDASCLRGRIRNLLEEEFDKPTQDVPNELSSSSDQNSMHQEFDKPTQDVPKESSSSSDQDSMHPEFTR